MTCASNKKLFHFIHIYCTYLRDCSSSTENGISLNLFITLCYRNTYLNTTYYPLYILNYLKENNFRKLYGSIDILMNHLENH